MIYVFAIQLVSKRTLQGLEERVKSSKMIAGGLAALAGLVVVCLILLKAGFYTQEIANVEASMKEIGMARRFREVSVCTAIRVHLSIPAGMYHRRLGCSKKGG